jgi:hypothetical protein
MKLAPLIVIFILSVAVLFAILRSRGAGLKGSECWPLYPKKPLSQPEQVLYHRLVRSLPEHIVLAQVQVSRVLGVRKGYSFHQWNNRINRMSYDFVVCSPDSTVIAAIELDDASHDSASRIATDQKKSQATAAAGVRLIRWHVKSLPDNATIRAALVGEQPNNRVERAHES